MKITKITVDHQRIELNGHIVNVHEVIPNSFNVYGDPEALATIKINLGAKKIRGQRALNIESVKNLNGVTSDVFDALAEA